MARDIESDRNDNDDIDYTSPEYLQRELDYYRERTHHLETRLVAVNAVVAGAGALDDRLTAINAVVAGAAL